ncbi:MULTISPECIES: flagellar basal body protein [unclassified Roseitalea]|uniref:flagellar basal body protein n=1 Tax=unclassified Roseitalea TaxID=2639107 RepID=UPI00273E48CA|nr:MULTISPECIES: flagellar basal body protein [unclassified Roseitalea]
MTPVQLFDLATRQAQWLSARQAAIAGNIANANAPGYQTMDVVPFEASFEAQMQLARVRLQATHPDHVGVRAGAEAPGAPMPAVESTGKPVGMEQELAKSGAVRAGMQMNTAVVAAFHRMTLMVTKG